MCGIYGCILKERKKIDTGIMRALTLANRERGKEACGFFDSTESIFKQAQDPLDLLADSECTAWLDRSEHEAWFQVGHTRFSTRGRNIDANSHPFQYGDVIGSHNGIIDAPYSYTVDSEFAIDMLDQNQSNYQQALGSEWGYWTLAWYDKRVDKLFISMHDNSCGIVYHRGAWYFSSDPDHLSTALGVRDTIVLKTGDTVSFDRNGSMERLKKFSSDVGYSYKRDSRTNGKSRKKNTSTGLGTYAGTLGKSANTNYSGINDPDDVIRDYDSEFRSLWGEYASQYTS